VITRDVVKGLAEPAAEKIDPSTVRDPARRREAQGGDAGKKRESA
jgi:hypothetical protein